MRTTAAEEVKSLLPDLELARYILIGRCANAYPGRFGNQDYSQDSIQ